MKNKYAAIDMKDSDDSTYYKTEKITFYTKFII